MKVDLALTAVFVACTALSSSLGQPVLQLPLKSGKRLAKAQVPSYHTTHADPFNSFLLNPHLPPPVAAPSASDQHFQWWGAGTSPELVQSGWYGFNRFSPRPARNMRAGKKVEYLLGENSYVSMFPHVMFQGGGDQAVLELFHELKRNIHPVPHVSAQYVQPRIVMIDQAVGLQPGVLVPVRHPRYHQLFSNSQQKPTRTRSHRRRQQSASVPVTIKVVPLKITSADIANALKSMSFLPFPLDLDQGNQNKGHPGANANVAYDDSKGSSNDDDDDLPPPSSHVAMPVDKDGLGIVYADSRRLEHSIRDSYQPR